MCLFLFQLSIERNVPFEAIKNLHMYPNTEAWNFVHDYLIELINFFLIFFLLFKFLKNFIYLSSFIFNLFYFFYFF